MSKTAAIAIDGPVASGKTAVGRLLAKKLGYRFLDTGIMYRAVAWAAIDAGVSPEDSAGLTRLAQERRVEVVFWQDGEVSVRVRHKDITANLRQTQVEQVVSLVARAPGVREVLASQQRKIAMEGPLVMAGRDIGTVVLPDASLKLFLTASIPERARRRHAEFQALGLNVPYEKVVEELKQRDQLDSEREVAPLRPAADAHVIVTDDLSVEEVVEQVLKLMRQ